MYITHLELGGSRLEDSQHHGIWEPEQGTAGSSAGNGAHKLEIECARRVKTCFPCFIMQRTGQARPGAASTEAAKRAETKDNTMGASTNARANEKQPCGNMHKGYEAVSDLSFTCVHLGVWMDDT